jgi:hypothetical protein
VSTRQDTLGTESDVHPVVEKRAHLLPYDGGESHDAICDECDCHITISRTSGEELGHHRGWGGNKPDYRCSHRPSSVDPINQGDTADE